jgi:polysaccharide biosynthesis protein VpsQ
LRKLFALLFLLFLILVAYWADSATMPSLLKAIYRFPNGDRVGHVVLYGILAFLLNLALSGRRLTLGRISLPLGSFLAAGFAVLEELSQFFFPARTPDLVDLTCGWLGIALATHLSHLRTRSEKGIA